MAVATTVAYELLDALVSKFRADSTLTSATYDVQVVDGPPLTDLSKPNILFVGAQPSDESGAQPDVTFDQSWGEVGARARYEVLTAACELWVRSGDNDLSTLRATSRILLAAIESALRTDFTLSIGRLMWCEIRAGQVIQEQTKQGGCVATPFVIAAKARLASQ